MAAPVPSGFVDLLAARTGRALDLAYSRLVHKLGWTGPFFAKGWGDLGCIDFEQDLKTLGTWPPAHFDVQGTVQWKKLTDGTAGGVEYEKFLGVFKTPCIGRTYDALPLESRTARVQMLLPKRVPVERTSCVVHLAGTGDQSFARRMALGFPLLKEGIGSLVLESPYYGLRRPAAQKGSKLHFVSDLLALGRATIEESLFLLHWAQAQGMAKLCMSGFSMGGVHASMVASLFPGPCAVAPLLAPRSAAIAFCHGALRGATAWKPLVAALEDTRQQAVQDAVQVAISSFAQIQRGALLRPEPLQQLQQARTVLQTALSSGPSSSSEVEHLAERVAQAAAGQAAAAPESALVRNGVDATPAAPATAAAVAGPSGRLLGAALQQQGMATAEAHPGDTSSGLSTATPLSSSGCSSSSSNNMAQHPGDWVHSLTGRQLSGSDLDGELQRLAAGGHPRAGTHPRALYWLDQVLEAYTDVTKYPRPQRPDAAVLVGATDDAYVSPASLLELHAHWPGSEVRWVAGGHVSAFLLHQRQFRRAISDSLARL